MALQNPDLKIPAAPNPTPRIIAILFIVSLLVTAFVMNRKNEPKNDGPRTSPQGVQKVDVTAAVKRYGFALTEVAEQSGIHFTHTPPRLDARLNHIMPEIAAMGASVSVVDFDRDGWNDLYVTDSGEGKPNHLYHNNHDGTFTDVAAQMGVADLNQPGTGASMGAIWGDFDNDGYEDLLVYKWGRCELFHNDGGKKFTRVTETAGLPKWANINSAVWVDYDRDGHLDLLLCGYYPDDIDLWHLKTTRFMPESFEFANNGGRKYLLHNRGDGTFEDVTEKMGLNSHRWTLSAVAADLRGTGYPDIILANDYGITEYFLNHEGKRFEEVGSKALYWDKLGRGAKSGMNASLGDILNQGKFALYVSNISEQGQLIQGNDLWVPEQDKSAPGDLPHYTNMAHDMGVELGGWSFGAQFGDLNNDGNLDIYLTNGYVSANPDQSYWYDFGKVAGANTAIISDAANWPALGNRSHSGYQSKCLWINDGAGKFTDVSQQVGATDRYDGRAVALADLWNRGQLDVIVANQRGPLLIYKNNVVLDNQWIEFDLEGKSGSGKSTSSSPVPAALSNASAIGAQVRLTWNGQTQLQEVSGGSGFCAQNQRRLHFGLGKSPKLEKAVIRWPSGKTQTLDLSTTPALTAGKLITVKES
jgi:enediyne biosynthesis protein E4